MYFFISPGERNSSKTSWTIRIVLLAVLLSVSILPSVAMNGPETLPPVGQINFFGYAGVDLHAVEAAVPLKLGDVIKLDNLESTQRLIEQRIKATVGREPSDVAFVCCDVNHHALVYIGLAGRSSGLPPVYPAPTGGRQLQPVALDLYRQDLDALTFAVQRGASREDDSEGYALGKDAALRKIQLAIRTYSVDRGTEFEGVLRDAGDAKQRSTAAALLGYARRSPEQFQALNHAILDPDADVRNNAVRALMVLESSNAPRVPIDVEPLAALLNSGVWSDRNKASLLLDKLTVTRDPEVLETLRRTAFDALVEGASWQGDPGHSEPFIILLGRMADVPENQILPESSGTGLAAIISKARSHQP